jgi:hypothetical protein
MLRRPTAAADALLRISIVTRRPGHVHHQSNTRARACYATISAENRIGLGETGGSEVQPERDRRAGSGPLRREITGAERLEPIRLLFLERLARAFRSRKQYFGECGRALAERTCGGLQTPPNQSTDHAARGCRRGAKPALGQDLTPRPESPGIWLLVPS